MTRRGLLALAAAPLFAQSLKITAFRIHKVTLRWRDLVFLEIQTDGGLVGLGEATLETRADVVEAALRWLEGNMKGLDPASPEEHWNRNYYLLSRWRDGAVTQTALSAVDIALWDLEGKRLGVPVSRLLGGPIYKDLRAYYTHWSAGWKERTPAALESYAREARERGWTAVKWTLPTQGSEAERIRQACAELEAVRKGAGDALDIGLEAAETFSIRSAIQFARALAPYKPLFLEEPTLRENPNGLAQVAAASPVPIATGEGLYSRFEFKQLIEAKGASIIQPDVLHAGGITELRKIANLAETYGVEIAPHQCSGPIAHVASLHAMSVCRNFLLQEWEAADDAVFQDLTAGQYPVQKNGTIRVPDKPGLGISVNFAEFTRRYPYKGLTSRSLLK